MVSQATNNKTIFGVMVILGGGRDEYKIIGQEAVGRGNDFVGSFLVESAKHKLFLYDLVQDVQTASGKLTQGVKGSEILVRLEGFDQVIHT